MTSRRFIMVSQSLSLPPQCVPDYLVERYHRTFEPEAERIRALLRAFSPEPGVASALSGALDRVRAELAAHVGRQEGQNGSADIIDGNFVNFNGTIAEVNLAKQKVKVSITIFGRRQPVEFDYHQLAKVG
jgi:transcription antitermination factor NusG